MTPATLTSITVSPTNPSIPRGTSVSFTATGHYSDGTTQDLTEMATWTSSDPSGAFVWNTAGSHGLAEGLATGAVTITAALGSVSGATTLIIFA